MSREQEYWAFGGGLDLVTPAIAKNPGYAIGSLNYEPDEAGYRRLDGYERFDGQPKPSEAEYWILAFTGGTTLPVTGAEITGGTSAAKGVFLTLVVESGSFATSDATGYFVLRNVTGTFVDGEALNAHATASGTAERRSATTDELDRSYLQQSVEETRTDIQKVPGEGQVRGVWLYKGDVYAFRDNVGATAGIMHKATTTGWQEQDLGLYLSFSGGVTAIIEGDTLTGDTSGATATVKRVVIKSGDWSTSDATGYFILSDQTGTFQAEDVNTAAAAISGDSSANSLPPGGRYEFANHNFYGASNLKRMYGCNGVGNAFEWDGSVFTPIETGMVEDKPKKIAIHSNHLFLAFSGGSVQHSGTGTPLQWSLVLGAGEMGLGDEVTAFLPEFATAMLIFTEEKIAILYGQDKNNWELKTLSAESGGIEHTVQQATKGIFLDAGGIRDIQATQNYGDFNTGTLSLLVHKIFKTKKKLGVTPTASLRVKGKDQYRLYWSDGSFMILDMSKTPSEIMFCDYGRVVRTSCSGKDANGNLVEFFGSDDGYVYQSDTGNNFDGVAMDYFIRFPYYHLRSPGREKRFMKAALEADAAPQTVLNLLADFSYGNPDQPNSKVQQFYINGGGGFWDVNNWNEFYWSSQVEGVAEADLEGVGNNISLLVYGSSTYEDSHTLSGVTIHYSPRRLKR